MKGLDGLYPNQPSSFIQADSSLNISLINSLILGSTLFVLLTFLLFPNPLFNFVFESLATSLI
jgi:hypothetical protein